VPRKFHGPARYEVLDGHGLLPQPVLCSAVALGAATSDILMVAGTCMLASTVFFVFVCLLILSPGARGNSTDI
jgi:hypothetical protein